MLLWPLASVALPSNMAVITQGKYRPLYMTAEQPLQQVDGFLLDKQPVTNRQYQSFIEKHPDWQKSQVPQLFAEARYLQHWLVSATQSILQKEQHDSPVVNVSWYAAQAYCEAQNKRLPTVAEWEYVALASEKQAEGFREAGYKQRILDWYGKPNQSRLSHVAQSPANYWGVYDMHGLIWEWTEDFNSNLVSGESRADSSINQQLFCAAGTVGAADPSDYAAFMRFGFRSSLKAKFTLNNLGFRCARSKEKSHENSL